MTPERWRQVTDVFHAALARDASARAQYLDHTCAGDRALRDEVDAMLAAHQDTGGFGDRPVSGSMDDVRRLETGAMVGPYRIDRLIGAGGMGEVYRARDTKLGRDVAIKVLPAAFTSDPEGLGSPVAPFMSPDGNWVGFFDFASSTLKKVTVNGGPAVMICDVAGAGAQSGGGARGASWGPDDTIVFATNDPATGLFRVSAAGGKPEMLTTPDRQKGEADHWWPEILPGREAVLFTILSTTGGIENAQIAVLNLRTGEQKVLVPGGSHPRYLPTEHIVYGVAGTLRAVAFDLGLLEVRSDPVPTLS